MEKLTYDDAFVMEIVVNKINEIIEELQESESSFDSRLNSNWKSHRLMTDRLDKLEAMVKKLGDKVHISEPNAFLDKPVRVSKNDQDPALSKV